MGPTSLVVRVPGVSFRRLDDSYLAIDARRGYCYSLNETASTIWNLIEQPSTVSEVCKSLTVQFSVPYETCLADTMTLLQTLHESGLIEVRSIS